MDSTDLRVFATVARLGGMTRAAGELNTVQPNVTARIRRLGQELGAPLFTRHRRGVSLTDAGNRLLPYATRVTRLIGEARHAVHGTGELDGRLSIGAPELTTGHQLAAALKWFTRAYPEVTIDLFCAPDAQLVDAVLARKIEAALIHGPISHPVLAREVIYREELVIATPPGISHIAELSRMRALRAIVGTPGCRLRQRLESILAGYGIVNLRRLCVTSHDAMLGCVESGLGIALLPRSTVSPARRREISLLTPTGAEAVIETLFVRRTDLPLSAPMAAFLDASQPARVAVKAPSRVVG